MQKKRESFIKSLAVTQIFSVVLFVFSFAFILGGSSFVRADILETNLPGWQYDTETGRYFSGDNWVHENAIENHPFLDFGEDGIHFIPPEGASGIEATLNQPANDDFLSGLTSPSGSASGIKHYGISGTGAGATLDVTLADGTLFKDILKIDKLPDGSLKVFYEGGEGVVSAAQSEEFIKVIGAEGSGLVDQETFEFFGTELATGGVAHLLKGVTWSVAVAGAIQLIAPLFGADSELTNTLTISAISGIMSFQGLKSLGPSGFRVLGDQSFLVNRAGLIGISVAVVVFIALYKKEKQKVLQYQCLPWEPPLGGNNCDACNDDGLHPCSEYRCRSLGQACDLVNKGTEEESCVWVSRGDVTSPIITPWDEPLSEGHSYTSHQDRPPSRGTRIVRDNAADGCLQAFTPLEFGILTNEPAQCKVDYSHTDSYEDMIFLFGNTNYYLEEHEQIMSLPSPDAISSELPEFENDGTYDLFVRCQDANGNINEDEFVFSFCVDPSPDTTPPIIVDTSIEKGAPVQFEVGEVDIDVYTNEPADCKWSVQDKDYDSMENEMSCSGSIVEINAQDLYTCSATLTGIKDREENTYYFRCKDQPNIEESERNVNTQSYVFTLQGTQPLDIIEFSPNETITDNVDVVTLDLTVETSNGAKDGQAICYFSDTNEEGSFVQMFETDSFEHRQTLTLVAGDYEYFFRCVDAGGNSDEAQTTFNVFVDTQAPLITRAYKELDALKITTDEEAECVYSLDSCNYNFDEGITMIHANPDIRTTHFTLWEPNLVYYIKCRDDFGNEPNPDACGLIASATNIV